MRGKEGGGVDLDRERKRDRVYLKACCVQESRRASAINAVASLSVFQLPIQNLGSVDAVEKRYEMPFFLKLHFNVNLLPTSGYNHL